MADETTDTNVTEDIQVKGKKLAEAIKDIVAKGNVRKVILKNRHGKQLLEIPVTAGVGTVAVAAFFAPWAVAVGAIAALCTSVTITVVHADPASPEIAEVGPVADAQGTATD